MRTPILTRVLLPAALISVAAAVPSHAQNLLTNGSFETQNPQLATNGKEAGGFSTVTGWNDTGTPGVVQNEDSGIQGNGNVTGNAVQQAEDGSFFAFQQSGDPGAFQVTGTQLVAGDVVTLTWFSLNSYQAPVQEVNILSAATATAAFSATSILASANGSTNTAYALPGVPTAAPYYTEYTLTYTATAADAGSFVGVSTTNIAPAGGADYLETDNYTLTMAAPTAVPEPRTYGMLAVGALTLLVVAYRRKQTLEN